MHPTQNPVPTDIAQPSPDSDWSPADLLRSAVAYLDRYGWTQRDFFTPRADSPFPAACLVGAVRIAVTGKPAMDIYGTLDGDCDPATRRTIGAALWAVADHLGIDT